MEGLRTGFNSHRLKEDDSYHSLEIKFVKEFNKLLRHDHNLINNIVHSKGNVYLSEEEEMIALSVIQWLGTPVGQSFLRDVNNSK